MVGAVYVHVLQTLVRGDERLRDSTLVVGVECHYDVLLYPLLIPITVALSHFDVTAHVRFLLIFSYISDKYSKCFYPYSTLKITSTGNF